MREVSGSKRHSSGKIKTEDVLFCLILIGGVCFVGGLGVLHLLGLDWVFQGAPCTIYRFTGWYCPGCGGTRALRSLVHGHLLESLLYHPAVLYLAGWTVIFLGWQGIHYLSRGKVCSFHYRNWHLWIAVALFVSNFIIKNAAQLMG